MHDTALVPDVAPTPQLEHVCWPEPTENVDTGQGVQRTNTEGTHVFEMQADEVVPEKE